MIASLEGNVETKELNFVVLNVGGIGYEVHLTDGDLALIKPGDKTKLLIYEQIKEDAHDLYGFTDTAAKKLFEQLLSVKNVGPRVAMSVLNTGSAGQVRSAVAGGDVKLLQSAKGVGRRAAEQIVVELRDKVGLGSSPEAEAIARRGGISEEDEAVEALIALGYSIYDARSALSDINTELPTEERIKQALKRQVK